MFPERSSLSRVVHRYGERFVHLETFRSLQSRFCASTAAIFRFSTSRDIVARPAVDSPVSSYPTICLRYVPRGRDISARAKETTRGPGSSGESSIAEALAGARNRVEIARASAPRVPWLVKRLKDCPPPRCFHVKYLLFALLFFSYFSLVSPSILYRAGTYESLIARFSCKAISLSRRSRHNSESSCSKISFSSDVKYLNKFQRLPFVGIPREVKGQISYKNQVTGKSNGD